MSETVDPVAGGISMEGVQQQQPSLEYNMGSVSQANPILQESPLRPHVVAESSPTDVPPGFNDNESGNASSSGVMPLPTPEVPSRLQQAGSLAAGGARLTGKAIYRTARAGFNAMDTIFSSDGTLASVVHRATGPPPVELMGRSSNMSSGTRYG